MQWPRPSPRPSGADGADQTRRRGCGEPASGSRQASSRGAEPRARPFRTRGYLDAEVDTELVDALAQLPMKQRAVLVLFYYADASVREVARRTGTSQLAVRANLSRGRKRLKQILGDRDD